MITVHHLNKSRSQRVTCRTIASRAALVGPMQRMDDGLKRHAMLLTELRAALEREA